MTECMHHRGPDDGGVVVLAADGVGLGHRRLSVVDLSPLGHQPIASTSGRWTITFNGEIYNPQALRATMVARARRSAGIGHRGAGPPVSRHDGGRAATGRARDVRPGDWDAPRRRLVAGPRSPRARSRCLRLDAEGGLTSSPSELKAVRLAPGARRPGGRPAGPRPYLTYGYVRPGHDPDRGGPLAARPAASSPSWSGRAPAAGRYWDRRPSGSTQANPVGRGRRGGCWDAVRRRAG